MKKMKQAVAMGLSAMMLLQTVTFRVQAEETTKANNDELDAVLLEDFKDTISSDYLSAHFYIKDFESYGIEKPEVTIGEGPSEEYQDAIDEAEKMIAKLKTFDYDSLSDKQQHDYDAVMFAYEDQLKRSQYWQFQWVFSPSNNVISNISTNLTEFVFYEKQDFYDYVTLVDTLAPYLDSCITFTQSQIDEGYFMSAPALNEALDELSDYLAKGEENPILADFNNDVEKTALLNDTEKAIVQAEAKEILMNSYLPKCQEVYDFLSKQKDIAKTESLYQMQNGLDYYTLNVQNIAATGKSIDEQFDELDTFLQAVIQEYVQLAYSGKYTEGSIGLTDAESILSYLSSHVTEYGFPSIPDVHYTAEYLDPTVVSGNILAYYMSSPVDDYTENSIKINGSNIQDSTLLYTTLAHEGYPGHLYQHVYYLSTNPSPLRTICSFLGYTEGWAMYAQSHATTWNVLSETDARMTVLDDALSYALCALADLGVNGKGWTEQDLYTYIDNLGLNAAAASSLYEQTLIYPGDYNSYGYGMARLMTYEQQAREALQDQFDLETFNRVILDNGPRTLDTVEKDVQAYIAQNTGTAVPTAKTTHTPWALYLGGVLVVVLVIVWAASRKKRGNA